MEAGADFQQTRDAAAQQDPPSCRLSDAAQDLEQCTFAGAIATDDAKNLALLDLKAHIFERPEFLDLISLHDLPPANDIRRFAREVAELAPDDVAECRIFVLPPRRESVPNQIPFG